MPKTITDFPAISSLSQDGVALIMQGGTTYKAPVKTWPESVKTSANLTLLRTQQDMATRIGMAGGVVDGFDDDSGIDAVSSMNLVVSGGTAHGADPTTPLNAEGQSGQDACLPNYYHVMKCDVMGGKSLAAFTIDAWNYDASSVNLWVVTFGADNVITAEYGPFTGTKTTAITPHGSILAAYEVSGIMLPIPVGGGFAICCTNAMLASMRTDVTTYSIFGRPVLPFISTYQKTLDLLGGSPGNEMSSPRNVIVDYYSTYLGVVSGRYSLVEISPIVLTTMTTNLVTAPKSATVSFVCSYASTMLESGALTIELSVDNGDSYEAMTTVEKVTVNSMLNSYIASLPTIATTGTQLKVRISVDTPFSPVFQGLGIFVS